MIDKVYADCAASDEKPSDIAHGVTRARLNISKKDTTRKLIYKTSRRVSTVLEHAVLASTFLDFCSGNLTAEAAAARDLVFKTLLGSSYPAIALYYLIWLMHDTPQDVCCGWMCPDSVARLCDAVKAIDGGKVPGTSIGQPDATR